MNEEKPDPTRRAAVFDSCPHCGRVLSPWEKVLLNVDRMLMCKGCWYRIVLDVFTDDKSADEKNKKDKNK
ncbi:MAG: hypothetical protein NTX22_12435 [Ignavibacteriales bacterium]|nr:hypothetical protein [Ignavibacteriales bacterium]